MGWSMLLRKKFFKWSVVLGIVFSPLGARADNSICISASAFLAQNNMTAQDGTMMVATVNSPRAAWSVASGGSPVVVPSQASQVFLAYFVNRPGASAGAVAARISLKTASASERTNDVQVYRRAIDRGTNRCEPRGRAMVDRSVKINEYMDYHDRAGGGVSSTLEDFHFKYPTDTACVKTNNQDSVSSFQFEDVMRTEGDTFVARNLSFVSSAFAVKINHEFSALRSELHYQRDGSPACIGLFVPLNRSPQASVVINEQGFGSFPARKSWLIGH
jgi:hypothetical protein